MKTSHSLFQNQFCIRSKIKSNSNYKFGFYFLRMFMKQKERLSKKKFKKRIFFKGTLLCTCSICVCTTKCFRFLFGLTGTVQRKFWHPTMTIDPPPHTEGQIRITRWHILTRWSVDQVGSIDGQTWSQKPRCTVTFLLKKQ